MRMIEGLHAIVAFLIGFGRTFRTTENEQINSSDRWTDVSLTRESNDYSEHRFHPPQCIEYPFRSA